MGKRQEIVILRSEVARWQALYEAAVTANRILQEQLLALATREPDAAVIVREVMTGFKAVMNPELPALPEPADPYSIDTGPGPAMAPRLDPAWEIPNMIPDGFSELLEREGLEDEDA